MLDVASNRGAQVFASRATEKSEQLPAVSTDEPVTEVQLERYGLDGLTPKQYRFATLVFSGLGYSEAYRAAYDCATSNNHTVSVAAGELMAHPGVARKIRALRAAAEQQSTLSASLSRNYVLNGLMRLASGATKESVQLGALQTLGKTVGIDLFREIHVTETRTRTVDDVEQELKSKLDALRAGLTIDGSSRAVDPTAAADSKPSRKRKPKPA